MRANKPLIRYRPDTPVEGEEAQEPWECFGFSGVHIIVQHGRTPAGAYINYVERIASLKRLGQWREWA